MPLSRSMQDDPTVSAISVFQKFSDRPMAFQGKLNEDYKGDRYLSDRLQGSIYVPAIKEFLKYLPADNSQEIVNRVATHISDKPSTAEAESANWGTSDVRPDDVIALYSLGIRYGVNARRPVKGFVKGRKGTSFNRIRLRRQPPRWMKRIRG